MSDPKSAKPHDKEPENGRAVNKGPKDPFFDSPGGSTALSFSIGNGEPKPGDECKTKDGKPGIIDDKGVCKPGPTATVSVRSDDDDLDAMYATPPCDVAQYDDLSAGQKALIDRTIGKEAYGGKSGFPKDLGQLERAVFVNITGALEKAGVDLTGLKLQGGGIRSDRLFFEPGTTSSLETSIRAGTATKPPSFDSVSGAFGGHDGMSDYVARQNVPLNSLQVGFGTKGAFADIDLFNPKFHPFKHWEEVRKNDEDTKTPHFYIAKVLGNCK